jgi:hypothetical protein
MPLRLLCIKQGPRHPDHPNCRGLLPWNIRSRAARRNWRARRRSGSRRARAAGTAGPVGNCSGSQRNSRTPAAGRRRQLKPGGFKQQTAEPAYFPGAESSMSNIGRGTARKRGKAFPLFVKPRTAICRAAAHIFHWLEGNLAWPATDPPRSIIRSGAATFRIATGTVRLHGCAQKRTLPQAGGLIDT